MNEQLYAGLIGRTIGGCRVERRVGSGGMGVVFEAHHLALEKRVAVKLLMPHLAADENFVKRFVAEGRLAAQIEHPNVVQILNVGQDGQVYFIVMQFIEGRSLAELIRSGPLSPRDAAKVVLQAAKGLAAAHKRGIIHRDVKPENILVDGQGVARIVDMGLSKALGTGGLEGASLTATGVAMGTPNYISPEQANEARSVDPRTDIYSLGATLYHALSGQPPFTGPSAFAIINQHVNAPLPPLASRRTNIPAELDRLVARMMAKRPEDRVASMDEVASELRKFLAGGASAVMPGASGAQAATPQPAPTDPTVPLAPGASPARRVTVGKDGVFVSSEKGTVRVNKGGVEVTGPKGTVRVGPGGVEVARANEAVGAAPATAERKSGGKWKYMLLGALGMLGALVVVGILISAADPARKPYRAAEAFERDNPTDFDGCRSRYEAARAANPTGEWARKAAMAIAVLTERQDAAASGQMSLLRPRAEALGKSGDWAGAEQAWRSFPANLASSPDGRLAACRADEARVARRSAELFAALAEGGVEKALPYIDPRKDQKAVRGSMGFGVFLLKGFKVTVDGLRVTDVALDAPDRATLHMRFTVTAGAQKPEEHEHEQSWQKLSGEWYLVEDRRVDEPGEKRPRPREHPGKSGGGEK